MILCLASANIDAMALNERELLHVYRCLHEAFKDDLHIARPLVHMLQRDGEARAAAELAIGMARRLLAIGDAGSATGFIELCRQMDIAAGETEIEELALLARLAGEAEVMEEERHVFSLIDQLSDQEALDFLRQGHLLAAASGRDIVHQGEVGRSFYLILSGEMRMHVQTDGSDITVGSLQAGDYFGEFACIYQLPRSATVTASCASELLEFSELAVRQLLQRFPMAGERLMHTVQMRLMQTMAHSHPALAELVAEDRDWLAEEGRLLEFEDGELIARQGKMGEDCYIILYGEAQACKRHGGKSLCTPFISGDMFADISPQLLLPPNCEVHAHGRCLVCRIPRPVFLAFTNAYGMFEQWIKQYGEARQRQWQELTEQAS